MRDDPDHCPVCGVVDVEAEPASWHDHIDARGCKDERQRGESPQPVLVFGRRAIHKDHHQKGIGTALLNDAIRRAIHAADIAGVTALLVHAISKQARRLYLSRRFIESPVKPMTLCLMRVTVDQALREP